MVASADLLVPPDRPRSVKSTRPWADLIFHQTVRSVAAIVFVIFGSIGVFLAYQSIPTFHRYGFSFLTQSNWDPELNKVGISSTLLGTVEVALVALVIAFPVAVGTALFISEYAPERIKSFLVSLVDLMAAVPSVIYGAWGFFLLMPHAKLISRWISGYFGWIPIFKVDTDPSAATWAQSKFRQLRLHRRYLRFLDGDPYRLCRHAVGILPGPPGRARSGLRPGVHQVGHDPRRGVAFW